jgi:MFS superfamily sulfate permease-like transporter
MTPLIGLWTILVLIIGLNGFAAGMVAVLKGWRSKQSRRSRALTAAAVAGLFPAAIALPAMAVDVSAGSMAPLGLILGIAVICVVAMVASLPGAVIVARKLDGPGDAFRAFE